MCLAYAEANGLCIGEVDTDLKYQDEGCNNDISAL